MNARAAWLALSLAAALGLSGCERIGRNMYDQPRFKPYQPTPLFPDGTSARPQVSGTVAHAAGVLAETSSGRTGAAEAVRQAALENAQALPAPVTIGALERGRERFDIYCAPCHGPAGDGDGFVARRGYPHPPSFHSDRLRRAPDRHFYDVMSTGYGAMYPYSDRLTPADRWAVVAYIRALQLSQHMPAELLDATDLSKLERGSR